MPSLLTDLNNNVPSSSSPAVPTPASTQQGPDQRHYALDADSLVSVSANEGKFYDPDNVPEADMYGRVRLISPNHDARKVQVSLARSKRPGNAAGLEQPTQLASCFLTGPSAKKLKTQQSCTGSDMIASSSPSPQVISNTAYDTFMSIEGGPSKPKGLSRNDLYLQSHTGLSVKDIHSASTLPSKGFYRMVLLRRYLEWSSYDSQDQWRINAAIYNDHSVTVPPGELFRPYNQLRADDDEIAREGHFLQSKCRDFEKTLATKLNELKVLEAREEEQMIKSEKDRHLEALSSE